MVGLGFNIKMLEAFVVLPAFYLMYLVAAPVGWRRRMIHLGLATVMILAASLPRAVAVDLTPADQRPYVGSSSYNTVADLIIGWNGVGRLVGSDEGVGDPGPLRLLNRQLAGQIGRLIPLAVVGLVAASWRSWQGRPSLPLLNRRQQALVLWGTWLVSLVVFFSVAGDWDPHYLAMLAPPVASLVGVGVVALWHDYRSPGWRGWVLPLRLRVQPACNRISWPSSTRTGATGWRPRSLSWAWVQPQASQSTLEASFEGQWPSFGHGRGKRRGIVPPARPGDLGRLYGMVRCRNPTAERWSSGKAQ